jgi:hypothetical protein
LNNIAAILILIFLSGVPILAQKPKSDREDEGLKGKVKNVITETADLSNASGKFVEGRREPSLNETYDADGSLIEQIFYDYMGNLSETRKYGYIDGQRTSKHERVRREYDPPPAALPSRATAKKWDPRYDWMYKYKYDANGNRIEKTIYQGDGSLWIRDVTKFGINDNKIEWARYSANGSLNFSSKSKYDEKGSESEQTYFNADGSVSSKYSYMYEFDQEGNWIKRVGSKWITKEGREFFEAQSVTYRKIAYY